MRLNSDKNRILLLMDEIGQNINEKINIYFTGGVSAVLLDIREMTIDVDIKFEPDIYKMYEVIKVLKESININIELASPDNFIPELPEWRDRSLFINQVKKASFYHYDFYSQIIAKIQRNWKQDWNDAKGFAKQINPAFLEKLFIGIKNEFIKFPSIDVKNLEKRIILFKNEIEKSG